MSWFSVNDLRSAGIAPPVPWRRVPAAMNGHHGHGLGFGMGGLGAFGRGFQPTPADPAELSAATAGVESNYGQIKSLASQIQSTASEIASLTSGVSDPGARSAADDAALLAENAKVAAGAAAQIYGFAEEWVVKAVDPSIHGGWAFGRDVVIGNSTGGSKNMSGMPLFPSNRLMILQAAVRDLTSVKAGLASDLGSIRSARDAAQKQVEVYRAAVRQAQEASNVASQASQFTQSLTTQAQQIEQERVQQAQQLARSQAEFELRIAAQRQQLEQQKLESEQRLALARQQAEEQALARQAASAAAQDQLALQQLQAKAAQELQFAAARQQADLQAQYAQQQPAAYYPAAAPYSQAMAPMTGAFPSVMQPTAWPQWNQAAAAAQAAGINPGSVVSYGQSQQQTFAPQSQAMQPGFMPGINTELNLNAGGGVYGYMGGLGAGTAAGQSFLNMLPSLISAGGGAASNVIRARQGLGPLPDDQAAAAAASSGSGAGMGIGTLVVGGVVAYGAYKLFFSGKSGGRGRRRR